MASLTRRDVLKVSAGLGMAAVLSGPSLSWGGLLDRLLPQEFRERLPITPNEQFYVTSYRSPPDVRLDDWSLNITGAVERPITLTYEQLLARPRIAEFVTLECVGNGLAADAISTAQWEGVRLRTLLEEAGMSTESYDVVFHAADGYSDSIRAARELGDDVLVAYKMNGEPLPNGHGFPARIIVPGIYGMKNVQWLTGIEVLTTDFQGYYQRKGWSDEAIIKTSSHIDWPVRGDTIRGSDFVVRGYAFAGTRGVRLVEISMDGGEIWHPATLAPPISPLAWVFWSYRWTGAPSGRYSLMVRATDGTGRRQLSEEQDAFPDGASGIHEVSMTIG